MSMEEIYNKATERRCIMCGRALDNRHIGYCFRCQTTMENYTTSHVDTQEAKVDSGKPNLSLVPTQIIYEIEKVRAFGSKKYKGPDNWKSVELERYHQALLRHTLAIWDDVGAKDKESGLLHLSHMATNIAFILELMKDGDKDES